MVEKPIKRQAIKIVWLCVAWYSFSSANNVIGKQVFNIFPYPMTLCMVQLLALNALLGPGLALLNVQPAPYTTRRMYTRRIVPLAFGKLLGTLSAHVSILKVSLSYAHTGENCLVPPACVILAAVGTVLTVWMTDVKCFSDTHWDTTW